MAEIETSPTVASIAGSIIARGNPLDTDDFMCALVEALDGKEMADRVNAADALLRPIFADMLTVAGSALAQREHHSDEGGLGIQVNLIDVFAAWGEREATDTAMLIDLCLGAALSQLLPFHEADHIYPCQVRITAAMLTDLASSGRIVRLQPEPNVWSVRLIPNDNGNPLNEEWGKLGWLRRHITAFHNYHTIYECEVDAQDYAESAKWHEERRILGDKLLAIMDEDGRQLADPERENAPGENAPEKQIADSPLSSDVSEPSGEKLDSQDGFGDNGS